MRAVFLLLLPIVLIAAACDDGAPQTSSAIDRHARAFLRLLGSRDLDSIRAPLSGHGRESVDNRSLARIFGYYESGQPEDARLIGAEYATSNLPSPAERHRLIYDVTFPDRRRCFYHVELQVAGTDTTITGFQLDRHD